MGSNTNRSTCPKLNPVERALRDSLKPSEFRDVHLYAFSRRTTFQDGSIRIDRPLPIVAIGSILKDTEYFSNLLNSGFEDVAQNDGQNAIWHYAREGEYDYESDSDLDECEEPDDTQTPVAISSSAASKSKPKPEFEENAASSEGLPAEDRDGEVRKLQRIPIRGYAYRTLKACIFYLYTKKIDFLPLTSKCSESKEKRETQAAMFSASPCSPKSMYRLADAYGIQKLRELAYNEIVSQLDAQNVVPEAFSKFFSENDGLRQYAVSYISRNYWKPEIREALPRIIKKLVEGELPHAGDTLLSLLGLRVACPSGGPAGSLFQQWAIYC